MEGLGIDLTWFLFQLGNFIVLLVGLTYLLQKPLSKLLETRRQEIAESLENAARIREDLVTTEEKQKEMLAQTRKESAAVLKETQERARELEEKLTQDAKDKADRFAETAKKDLENERERLRHELRAELADMVVVATEKILSGTDVSDDKKKDIKTKIASLK